MFLLVCILFACNKKPDLTDNSEEVKLRIKSEFIDEKNIESYRVLLDMNANDSLNYESLAFSLLLADEQNSQASMMVFVYMIELFNKKQFDINKFGNLSSK